MDTDSEAVEEKVSLNENGKKRKRPNYEQVRGLSKWTSRLLDPSRAKSLIIEPRPEIPRNDEFLEAFGKREKEFDESLGKDLLEDVNNNHNNDFVDGNSSSDEEDDDLRVTTNEEDAKNRKSSKSGGCMIKISNLKYTTTEQTLREACEAFGTLRSLSLMQDASNGELNTGRAFVSFATEQEAELCLAKLILLDGRPLRCEKAAQWADKSSNARYFLSQRHFLVGDISKKCFQCGLPGHMEADCPNPPKERPCLICALTDHELRNCPNKAICFNCGIPGHLSRFCTQTQRQQQWQLRYPTLCTVCFLPGHDKYSCSHTRATMITDANVLCMVCGQEGHELCQESRIRMHLTFGSTYMASPSSSSLSCWNCGQAEATHVGKTCQRPSVEELSRNPERAWQELEWAESLQTRSNALPPQQQQQRGRSIAKRFDYENGSKYYHDPDLELGRGDNLSHHRAKSAPPTRSGALPRQQSLPEDRYDALPPRHERHTNAPVRYDANRDRQYKQQQQPALGEPLRRQQYSNRWQNQDDSRNNRRSTHY